MNKIIKVVTVSDIGNVRVRNEDAVFVNKEKHIYGVCDGIGSLKFGKETAEEVAQYFSEELWEQELDDASLLCNPIRIEKDMECIVSGINRKISSRNYDWYVRWGCTLCGVMLFNKNDAMVFNVGDSRCYILRNNQLIKITKDHTKEQLLLESEKECTSEELRESRHILCKYIGNRAGDQADFFLISLEKNDRLLLCTDGLFGEFDNIELERTMCDNADIELKDVASVLLNKALEHGGTDNISFVLIDL